MNMAANHAHQPILKFKITIHLWDLAGGEGYPGLGAYFKQLRRRAKASDWCGDSLIDRFLREQEGDYSTSNRVRHSLQGRTAGLVERITINVWDDGYDELRSRLIQQFCVRVESLKGLNRLSQWCAEAVIDRFVRESAGDYALVGFDSIHVGQSSRLAESTARSVSRQKKLTMPVVHADPMEDTPVCKVSEQALANTPLKPVDLFTEVEDIAPKQAESTDRFDSTRRSKNKPGLMVMG